METIEMSAFIAGITEIIKSLGIPSKYIPLVAIACGGLVNMYFNMSYDPETVIYGMAIGMMVTGVYKAIKQ